MAKTRKIALRLLIAFLSVSFSFNSPALAELVLCIGQDCESAAKHDGDEDPCESAFLPGQEPSLHAHEMERGCESCIQLSLLHEAGESIRPAPGPDGSPIIPPALSTFSPYPRVSGLRLPKPSLPQGDRLLAQLRTVRLLI